MSNEPLPRPDMRPGSSADIALHHTVLLALTEAVGIDPRGPFEADAVVDGQRRLRDTLTGVDSPAYADPGDWPVDVFRQRQLTTDILEYGVPVEVGEPPASQVIEQAEFNRLTGG